MTLTYEQCLPEPYYQDEQAGITIFHGRNEDILPLLASETFHAVVTDPPYGLRFMQAYWDYDVPKTATWEMVHRVLLPGAHLLSFFGTRTYHRGVVNIEDAGFEIRDQLGWVFASGFPKSLDVSKALDKAAKTEREVIGHGQYANRGRRVDNAVYGQSTPSDQEVITAPASDAAKLWNGWGSALKPAWESICLARKPLIGTIVENILEHRCGALNIDASRISGEMNGTWGGKQKSSIGYGRTTPIGYRTQKPTARYPSNILHDGSDEVMAEFAKTGERPSGSGNKGLRNDSHSLFNTIGRTSNPSAGGDTGSAARFFFCAKPSRAEREGNLGDLAPTTDTTRRNTHPTVKPLMLMQYLCRLICPPGGIILDPFMGSGSTILAAQTLGFRAVGIEQDERFCEIAAHRLQQRILPFVAKQQEEPPPVITSHTGWLFGEMS